VECVLYGPSGAELARTERAADKALSFAFPVTEAVLWSPESPTLYRFVCALKRGGEVADTFDTAVGLRTVRWSPETGMTLNGRRYFVKGICCHQDHGGVGAAVTPELMEYRIARLKTLGINAYRCVHHAMPDCFFEICDRLGMLVMAENRNFSLSEETMDQLRSLVKTARNHPSVFLYSLFNEEPWQKTERGYRMAKGMRAAVRALDGTRAVTAAMNGGSLEVVNASDALDVIGLNYYLARYDETHARTPGKAILGTENCPTYATRGESATDLSVPVYGTFGDDYAKSFAESMDETMPLALSRPYCAGVFPFSGFDSYGEPQPHEWPSVTSHWGILDACGFEKGASHRLAAWYDDALRVRLFPHWNHRDGDLVRVVAFTNGEEAELFLCGSSLGKADVKLCRAEWTVPYRAGTLTVRVRRGNETAEDTVRTALAAARLSVEDVTPLPNAHYEQSTRILNLSVTDENGTVVPDFCEEATLETEGISVLGVANGNPNDPRPLCDNAVSFFHGRAQVIVSKGKGSVTVRCGALSMAVVTE
ncbi:MAG: DUF4982 domain-containing protein, partial [Clostridia bacterium]|nr:DUF4982 domain-containing protein [Clostridia bacterium]